MRAVSSAKLYILRPFLSPPPPPMTVPPHWYRYIIGLLVLVSRTSSLLTEVRSSPLLSGLPSALTSTSLTSPPLPIIPSQMALLNAFTAGSKTLSAPAVPPLTGSATPPESSSVSAPLLLLKLPTSLLLNNFMVLHSLSPLNFEHFHQLRLPLLCLLPP